jgi:caspase domain-containing protein
VDERRALIIATSKYEDARLRQLRAPAADAQALERVLRDPEIGGFDVGVLLDQPHTALRRALAQLFRNRRTDDTLLVHLSCHGVKDSNGELYFASVDTETELLDATAVAASWLKDVMGRSRSRRIVLMLDCCYSGAFARGMLARGGATADTEQLKGRGRAILTATDSLQYSFEGDRIEGEATPSFFTSAIVRALESGEADRDGDGWISVNELYDYVHDEVGTATSDMQPQLNVLDLQGALLIARSPRGPRRSALPDHVQELVHSRHAHNRRSAVFALSLLLRERDPVLADAARSALQALARDRGKIVATDAQRALAEHDVPLQPPAAVQPAVPPVSPAATSPATPPAAGTSGARIEAEEHPVESGLVREVAAAVWDEYPRLTLSAPVGAGLTLLLVMGGEDAMAGGSALGAPLLVIWLASFFALLFWLQGVLITTAMVVRDRRRARARRLASPR